MNKELNENIEQVVVIFKLLGDNTRINIIQCLYNDSMNVTDIASITKMTHSAISHQLKLLKDANIVASKRNGKEMIYSLRDEHIKTIIHQVFTHLECEA